MATSGNTIFQLTRDEIINAALRKISVIGEDATANAAQLSTGAQALNAITATFQTLGMSLWARKELTITMVVGQRDYTIGVGETINEPFPIKIYESVLQQTGSDSQIDVTMMARRDFNLLPSNTSGTVVNMSYQPFINYGVVSVWPLPDSADVLTITYQAPFEFFVAGVDTPFFPQEWANALIYALAASLAPENGIPLQDRVDIRKEAKDHLDMALSNGTEDGSIFFGPNPRW